MIVGQPTTQDIPALITLWQKCFSGGTAFTDLFFHHRFEPQYCYVVWCEEKIVSVLYALPLTLVCKGTPLQCRYVYAVATHPSYRGRGFSSQLLQYTNQQLALQGVAATVLVPATPSLFAFYERQGYQNDFYLTQQTLTVYPANSVPLTVRPLQELYPLRQEFFLDNDLYAQWTPADLNYADMDNMANGGEVLYFDDPSPGYAVCVPGNDGICIKEYAAPKLEQSVLSSIAGRYGKEKIHLRLSPVTNQQPFGMIRWLIARPEGLKGCRQYLSLVLD